MQDIKLDLLQKANIVGKNRLKVFDHLGIRVTPTDFAIACGAVRKDGFGRYWTKTGVNAFPNESNYFNKVLAVDHSCCNFTDTRLHERYVCVRPAVPFYKIKNICLNYNRGQDKVLTVECGVFPQQSVSEEKELELKNKLEVGLLKEVDSILTDCTNWEEYDRPYTAIEQKVYKDIETNELYALVRANPSFDATFNLDTFFLNDVCVLSNGKIYKRGDYIFIKYAPIRWVVNDDLNIAFTREGIIAGLYFHDNEDGCDKFKDTFLYHYMNTELIQAMHLGNQDMYNVYANNVDFVEYLKKQNNMLQERINKNNEMIEHHLANSHNERAKIYTKI